MNPKIEDIKKVESEDNENLNLQAEFDDDYETKRTIDEVLDKETGLIIKSEDFFKKPESEIIAYRRRLQEAIAGFAPPKFVCAYCQQLVKLSGRRTRRGQVDFFAHLYDSDDCEIKTNGDLSKEEIEARKYGNVRESERHIRLKNKIADILHTTPNVKNIDVEKRITSDIPFLYWRRPDVYAEYEGKNLVFELQLSTTFLSVVVDRDIFYRMNKTFIVWVFNFDDNEEYVNLNNLMCKDIYYANKRNAFVFDEKAQKLSEETGELHLLCIWFEPVIENGIYRQDNDKPKEKYIKFSDLNFDDNTFKPYYIDADSAFAPFHRKYYDVYNQSYTEYSIDIDRLNELRLKKLAKKQKEKEYLQALKEEKIKEIKEQIKNGESILQLFQKNGKFGFECNGITIVEPTYSEALNLSDNGYFKVKKNKKFGLINSFGELELRCDYKELIFVFNDIYVVNLQNECFILNLLSLDKQFICKLTNKFFSIAIEKLSEKAVIIRAEDAMNGKDTVGILCNTFLFRKYNYIGNLTPDNFVLAKRGRYWQSGSSSHDGRYWNYTPKKYSEGKTVRIDFNGEELISDAVEIKDGIFKGTKYDKWGIETIKRETIIPFEYDEIKEFINGKAKAKKRGKWGIIDEQGDTIVSFDYKDIGDFFEGMAKCSLGDYFTSKYGYVNEQGYIIIPCEYDFIDDFHDGRANVKKRGKFGIIDKTGKQIIPCHYDFKLNFVDGFAQVKKDGILGRIDMQGIEQIETPNELSNGLIKGTKFGKWGIEGKDNHIGVLPFEYDKIEEFVDGKANIRKGFAMQGIRKGQWLGTTGVIDESGNIIIPCNYEDIFQFYDGKALAKKNNKYGYLNENGIIIVPFEYDGGSSLFINGKARVCKNSKWGTIDERGNIVIPFEYDQIDNFVSGYASAKKNGKIGRIDEQGKSIIEDVEEIANGIYKGKKFEKWGMEDTNGNIIITFEYDFIGTFYDGQATIKKDGLSGEVDEKGNGFIIFKENKSFIGNYGEKIDNWKFGIKDISGKEIIPAIYDKIEEFHNGKAKAYKDKKYIGGGHWSPNYSYKVGFIDVQGKIVIPFEYDEIEDFVEGKAKARKRGKTVYIYEKEFEYKQREINITSYIINSIHKGKISKIVAFGLFVVLEDGVSSLLHISELKKHHKTFDDFSVGNEIEVKILSIDKGKNRISLTL
jgi:hypothetical protein